MRIARLFVAMAIGLFLGYATWRISSLGYLVAWQRLSIPPEQIPALFSVTLQQKTPGLVKITKPCNYANQEFSFLAKPPPNIVDCLQREELNPGGSTSVTYVLDRSGTVWQRTNVNNTRAYYLGMLCTPLLGVMLGLTVGSVLELAHWLQTKRTLTEDH